MLIAGVDEAGRGPLAGPVVAAVVVLDSRRPIAGLADSKTLTAQNRETLSAVIKRQALGWAIGQVEVEDIDRLNILQASLLAMRRAVSTLKIRADLVLVDGKNVPPLRCWVQTLVKGDARVPQIAAASILAKVERDALMRALDAQFPVYGFAQHKGYPTRAHLRALQAHGPSPVHRRSFAPVREILASKYLNAI